jgi:hypothetical protein
MSSRGRAWVVAASVLVGAPALLLGTFVVVYTDSADEPLAPRGLGVLLGVLAVTAVGVSIWSALASRGGWLALALVVATVAVAAWIVALAGS